MDVRVMLRRPPVLDFRREFWFPAEPELIWREMGRFDDYPSWWSWLRRFRADRAGMVTGNVLRGTVVPPVPYPFTVEVRLDECRPVSAVRASIAGDVSGTATVDLVAGADGGTFVTCAWTLRMTSLPLRVAARTAFPLLRWGHDRVVQGSVETFRAHLAGNV